MHREQRDYHWSLSSGMKPMLGLAAGLADCIRDVAATCATSVAGIIYSFLIVVSSLFYDLSLCVVFHAVLDDDELSVLDDLL